MKSDDDLASVANTRIDESRNFEEVKNLRQAMLRGERHPVCKRCNEEDDMGIRSERMSHRGYWPDLNLQKITDFTKDDGSINTDDFPIRYVDLRTGNKCILQCRSCSPSSSSGLYAEHKSLGNDGFSINGKKYSYITANGKVDIENSKDLNWYSNKNFLSDFDSKIPSLRNIHVVGGEPLIIQEFEDIMKRIVDSGHAKNIKIECNSALYAIPNSILNLWKEFNTVSIGVSIDGLGDINNYIRYPSKWGTILRNIQKLDNAEGNYLNWFAVTVMAYNIRHLPELLEWIHDTEFNTFIKKDTSHPLWHPNYLSIKIFPEHMKKDIESHLLKTKSKVIREILEKYINFMYSEDLSHLLSKFWRITKEKDRLRGNCFEETIPDIALPIKEHLRKNGHTDIQ
jgi:MoaA/NifB/PqqE/SkfB family radical SAM enzyme